MINPEQFRFFSDMVRQTSGISLQKGKEYLLESRLNELARVLGLRNIDDLYRKTLDQCQTACVGNPRCLTLQFMNGKQCSLMADTALLKPSFWKTDLTSSWDHYQRTCA